MSLFTIDRDKCLRDGICAAECPAKIIELRDKNSFPEPAEGAAGICINCGHCVAVCPQGAISLRTMKPEDCVPLQKDALPGPEQVEHLLTSRRSIRSFQDRPVDREILSRIIDIARYAPSGHNTQPVHWLVIEDRGEVRRLAGLVVDWMRLMIRENPDLARPMHFDLVVSAWEKGVDRVCRGAPHVILAHAKAPMMASQPACIIALSYLELAAYSFGLGACWAGYFNAAAAVYPPMAQALNLPQGHQSYGAMMVGYPKYRYHRIPLRKKPSISWR
ncbi:MAG: nitroreductase family protein [Peptococcaceae bacterium]|nr:nitroreductase family protein [Peptococcaceae bacterium]